MTLSSTAVGVTAGVEGCWGREQAVAVKMGCFGVQMQAASGIVALVTAAVRETSAWCSLSVAILRLSHTMWILVRVHNCK